MMHHIAYVTHDSAATVVFYSQVLGLPFCSTVMDDKVPSTGEAFPYLHIFFRLPDDSTIAFFECPGIPEAAPVTHPAYDTFNHLALQVPSTAEVDRWKEWLESHGVDVVGPTDHKIIYSIYFHDPNGLRLELTTSVDPKWNRHEEQAWKDLEMWEATKAQARAEGRDVPSELVKLISTNRAKHKMDS
ncbi:MAG: VOC family protein [Alphaproteobacteria bacterium]|nr:VOC family protein [Alphaproteobacteria bacterium]